METEKKNGRVTVAKVAGKSTITRCFSCYPLKIIIPNKVGSSKSDCVWIYTLSYGGGIVSGDQISLTISIGDGCTAALTTQASTKAAYSSPPSHFPLKNAIMDVIEIYKSVDSKCSEQILEACVGRDALLAVIPDPITCFSTSIYSQKQVFKVYYDSNLIVVDWITSGRHERGERWVFDSYKSINQIYLEGDQPLFLDSVLLDQRCGTSIAERMQEYQVMAMVIISGPKLKGLQIQLQEEVKQMMYRQFHTPIHERNHNMKTNFQQGASRPPLIASYSAFGPKALGMVVRVAAVTTESVYMFLKHHLAALEPFIGASPYCNSGR